MADRVPAGDCNEQCPERTLLIMILRKEFSNRAFPVEFWAACQFCPLESLSELAKRGEASLYLLDPVLDLVKPIIQIWDQTWRNSDSNPGSPQVNAAALEQLPSTPQGSKKRKEASASSPAEASSGPSPLKRTRISSLTLVRSESERAAAELRDGGRCVITGNRICEIAHIYPFTALQRDQVNRGRRYTFWTNLGNFWSNDRIEKAKSVLFPDGDSADGIETTRNLIALSPDAHSMWNQGIFALKPVALSADEKELKIKFYWQQKIKCEDLLPNSYIDLATLPKSTRNLESFDGYHLTNYHNDGRAAIPSGTEFTLRTDDPVQRPLPSLELLELQWFLTRIIGLAGAGEKEDEEQDDDYDDENERLVEDDEITGVD